MKARHNTSLEPTPPVNRPTTVTAAVRFNFDVRRTIKEHMVPPALANVADHMKQLGLGALTHALRLSLYSAHDNPYWGDLSVLHAAHAAEILIKARIAMEHPLLIFEQIPKSTQAGGPLLAFEDLLEKGRTIDFQDLPERLWATTGQSLREPAVYVAFGRLRNAIQHFAPPGISPSVRTLEFVFKVLDPFLFENWDLYAIDFNEEFGDHYDHIFDTLVHWDVRPRISPTAAEWWQSPSFRPGSDAPPGYAAWFAEEMRRAGRPIDGERAV